MPSLPAPLECTALSRGLWRISLPFPSPLGKSFCYLLRSDTGVVAIDTGWDSDDNWEFFLAGLARAGHALDDLRGVVVTHAHPDHYGLTARIQEHSDAWVGLHPADRPMLVPGPTDRESRVADIEAWLVDCGAPADQRDDLLRDREHLLTELSPNLPTLDLVDGAGVPDTDGALTCVHTPGHTPGHLVFYDRSHNVLFTGDHLLPRISVNVSVRPTSGDDPLGDYEQSLAALGPYGDALAAPGHEWAFDRINKRIDQVRVHHAARLSEVEAAVHSGAQTPWEVAQVVSWSRPFNTLNARGRRSALGETASHLVRLEREGLLQPSHVGSSRSWTPASPKRPVNP